MPNGGVSLEQILWGFNLKQPGTVNIEVYLAMQFSAAECDEAFDIEVTITDPDGKEAGNFSVHDRTVDVDRFSGRGYIQAGGPISLAARVHGVYDVSLLVNGKEVHSSHLSLTVRES